jgi:hypothetical protein
MLKKVTTIAIVLILVACDPALTHIDPKTELIAIDYPPGNVATLNVELNEGNLSVKPGSNRFVNGSIFFDIKEWTPEIGTEGSRVTIQQGKGRGVVAGWKHDWSLQLGSDKPFDLKIISGMANDNINLGGLPLLSFLMEKNQGQARIAFDSPNPVNDGGLNIKGGDSKIHITGLLNANVKNFNVQSGVAPLAVDFTGKELKRNLSVSANVGSGGVLINIKKGVPAQIVLRQGSTHADKDFILVDKNTYQVGAFDRVAGPKISITIEASSGTITLKTIE